MNLDRRHVIPVLVAWALCIWTAAAQTPPIKHTNPSVVAPPEWSRVVTMPDGRKFVSEGGLAIDVKIAKPDTMPSVVLPVESGKIVAKQMAVPHDREIGLDDLRPGGYPHSFATPDGIEINGNYVRFLRKTATASKTRLRTKGNRDPIMIVVDGEIVGIMMPLAPKAK